MAKVHVLSVEDVARIEAVAARLFADCGPRLTGDDRSHLAAQLRDVLRSAVAVDEADVSPCLTCGSDDKCKMCGEPATDVAQDRDDEHALGKFCEKHAEETAQHGKPEYLCTCPNCGCMFGKN